MPIEVRPDAITFAATARPIEYGDGRTFYEYTILMSLGKRLVGMEHGPRRITVDRAPCLKAARERIAFLKSRRLFAIRITRKHISDGEARNCNTCAIAQALWHNQERMGFDKREFSFEVSPYGAWVDPRGIVLRSRYGDEQEKAIPAEKMPMIAGGLIDRPYSESMMEWAMQFDEWAESRYMSLREWREMHGYASDEWPCRPAPGSFVLDLDAMEVTHAD